MLEPRTAGDRVNIGNCDGAAGQDWRSLKLNAAARERQVQAQKPAAMMRAADLASCPIGPDDG